MSKKSKAAKREAGKVSAKKLNDECIFAEIGKVYLVMEKRNGTASIEFNTGFVDPHLNALRDFATDEHGVFLEPERMIGEGLGYATTEVSAKAYAAIRKWIPANTDWKFMKDAD